MKIVTLFLAMIIVSYMSFLEALRILNWTDIDLQYTVQVLPLAPPFLRGVVRAGKEIDVPWPPEMVVEDHPNLLVNLMWPPWKGDPIPSKALPILSRQFRDRQIRFEVNANDVGHYDVVRS